MNLHAHLLSRIVCVALLCLLATLTYALHRSEQQSRLRVQIAAESIAKQLELQLMRQSAGYSGESPFPDFDVWKQTSHTPGICVRYVAAGTSASRSLCQGEPMSEQRRPIGFATLYRHFFDLDIKEIRPVLYNGRHYGELTVSFSDETTLTNAWYTICNLIGLSILTLFTVCVLVYLVVNRALRPAHSIVAGLKRIEHGDLDYRLPDFELTEWQQTALAINHLVAKQQQLLSERRQLAVQLMNLQEDERRYLAREFHDEFGQCLAAINAVAASIAQTAETSCPGLTAEANQVRRFSQHLLESMRAVLLRLRPAELDELGLAASLNTLVGQWNKASSKTRYTLRINGDDIGLSAELTIAVFRTVQEGLTNIAKHASATHAAVEVNFEPDRVSLTIRDDGIATALPLPGGGMGLPGMRERIEALHGQLSLSIAEPQGLMLNAWLPTRLRR
ncbi:MAG: histidine kinase [Gammaproteobacteria bacterium]